MNDLLEALVGLLTKFGVFAHRGDPHSALKNEKAPLSMVQVRRFAYAIIRTALPSLGAAR